MSLFMGEEFSPGVEVGLGKKTALSPALLSPRRVSRRGGQVRAPVN